MLIRMRKYLWDNIYQWNTPKKISHLAPFCSYGPPFLRCQIKFAVGEGMNKKIGNVFNQLYTKYAIAEIPRLYDEYS
jgi:hypothetical protein